MAKAGGAKKVALRFRAESGSKVFLAGTFNKWDPMSKPLLDREGNGVFTTTIMLPPGRYEYKFVVNGVWCVDPECSEWVANDQGSLNSVLTVG
jgi:1,4-alpha-glucan branching enzyme